MCRGSRPLKRISRLFWNEVYTELAPPFAASKALERQDPEMPETAVSYMSHSESEG